MIKINLLKHVSPVSLGATRVAEGVVYGEVKKANPSTVLVKLILIVSLPFGLHQYEVNNLTDLQRQLANEQNVVRQLDKEIQELGAAVEVVKQYKQKKRVFDEQIRVIAELSRSRLDEVFALDNLQTLIPDRLWLIDLKVDGRNMWIKGTAISETEITALIQKLEESVFFTNVVFSSTVEKKTDRGVLQEFEVSCVLETIE